MANTKGPGKDKNEIRQKLGNELRSMYNSVMEEPLPDSMMEFLRNLDQDAHVMKDKSDIDRDDSGG